MKKNEKQLAGKPVALDLKDALSVIELEERHEMTVASQALSCGDNTSCNQSCGKTKEPAAAVE